MAKEPEDPQEPEQFIEKLVPLTAAIVTGRTAGKIAANGVFKLTGSKGLASVAFLATTAGTAYYSFAPLQRLTQTVKDKLSGDNDNGSGGTQKPKTDEDKINEHLDDLLNGKFGAPEDEGKSKKNNTSKKRKPGGDQSPK